MDARRTALEVIYEPQYALNKDKTDYIPVLASGTQKTKLRHPMPISMTFFAGQGVELFRTGRDQLGATGLQAS